MNGWLGFMNVDASLLSNGSFKLSPTMNSLSHTSVLPVSGIIARSNCEKTLFLLSITNGLRFSSKINF